MVVKAVEYQERREKSQSSIRKLVSCRTDALSLLGQLAAQQPLTEDDMDTRDLLAEFCETLIDYTATAHFQMYRYIDEKKERRQAVLDVAGSIYPQILKSTRTILDFNDKYDNDERWDMEALVSDLSGLGEILADRIELEDQLVNVLIEAREDDA